MIFFTILLFSFHVRIGSPVWKPRDGPPGMTNSAAAGNVSDSDFSSYSNLPPLPRKPRSKTGSTSSRDSLQSASKRM